MTIEAQLAEQTEILKSIHTLLSTQQQLATATLQTGTVSPAAEEKKTRTTKNTKDKAAADAPAGEAADPLGLVDGDASGTRYWISDSLSQVYAQKPGDPDPKDATFKIESAALYSEKKAEFAKKSADAAAAQKGATSEPSATATPDTASDVSFADVSSEIMAVNQTLAKTDPDAGRAFVLDVLNHFGCAGKRVPALAELGKNAEILAYIKAKSAAPANDLF